MRPVRNSAKALVIRDGKVLALRMLDEVGPWYLLPGGGQEPGENLHAALRRECLEEIGVDVVIGDLRFVRDYIGRNHEFAQHDGDVHQVEFIFACRLAEGAEVKPGTLPDKGQLGIEWLELEHLDNYRLYPLALRPVIARFAEQDAPVYLGDIN